VIGVYAVGDEKVMGVTDFGTEKPNPLRKGVLRATPAHTLQSSSLGIVPKHEKRRCNEASLIERERSKRRGRLQGSYCRFNCDLLATRFTVPHSTRCRDDYSHPWITTFPYPDGEAYSPACNIRGWATRRTPRRHPIGAVAPTFGKLGRSQVQRRTLHSPLSAADSDNCE
jgi:hypothetical protein